MQENFLHKKNGTFAAQMEIYSDLLEKNQFLDNFIYLFNWNSELLQEKIFVPMEIVINLMKFLEIFLKYLSEKRKRDFIPRLLDVKIP